MSLLLASRDAKAHRELESGQSPGGRLEARSHERTARERAELFTREASTPVQRVALECLAVLDVLDESMLARLLGRGRMAVLSTFDWLASLGMVETCADGLALHSVVRTALLEDLAWRNPSHLRALMARASELLVCGLAEATTPERKAKCLKSLRRLLEVHPDLRTLMRGVDGQPFGVSLASASEEESIVNHVQRCDGLESARALKFWLERTSSSAQIVRDSSGRMLGYAVSIRVAPDDPHARRRDPFVRALDRVLVEAEVHDYMMARWWADCEHGHAPTPVCVRAHLAMAEEHLSSHSAVPRTIIANLGVEWDPLVALADFVHRFETLSVQRVRQRVVVLDWADEASGAWLQRVLEKATPCLSGGDATAREARQRTSPTERQTSYDEHAHLLGDRDAPERTELTTSREDDAGTSGSAAARAMSRARRAEDRAATPIR